MLADWNALKESVHAPLAPGDPGFAESRRVKKAVSSFLRRRTAVYIFIGLLIGQVVFDIVRLNILAIMLDCIVVWAAVSLLMSLRYFSSACRTGSEQDLKEGLLQMVQYIRINAISGWILVAIMILMIVLAIIGVAALGVMAGGGHLL